MIKKTQELLQKLRQEDCKIRQPEEFRETQKLNNKRKKLKGSWNVARCDGPRFNLWNQKIEEKGKERRTG